MSSLTDRLRGVIRPQPRPPHSADGGGALEERNGSGVDGAQSPPDPASLLGGEWDESGQRFVTVERRYTPGHRHGDVTVADGLPPTDGAWPALALLARTPCHDRLLFVDLETTGLMGGAGTCAFLVGCGWFDGGTFRIRQYLLASPGAERAMLGAITALAADAGTVVTYNGKSFDLPLIETRYLFHRLETPFAGMPHVDMLHPARRLWRTGDPQPDRDAPYGERESGCRLSTLERTLCGFEREGDVPGFEIPERYFRYVRTGDARPLAGVLEHNRLDLLSLALLTARAAQLLEDGVRAARTAREAFGLGRLYQAGGRLAEARECFEVASGLSGSSPGAAAAPGRDEVLLRADALRAYAQLARRARRFDDAAAAWTHALELRGCPSHIVREATEALAVHHEHRLRDPRQARGFALRSLQIPGSESRKDALQHRLARLNRKLGTPPGAPLF